jgi:hypothetical protein
LTTISTSAYSLEIQYGADELNTKKERVSWNYLG